MMGVTAAMDEFMATVLCHLRTGQSNPLEELGLEKAADEIRHWRPDFAGSGAQDQTWPRGDETNS